MNIYDMYPWNVCVISKQSSTNSVNGSDNTLLVKIYLTRQIKSNANQPFSESYIILKIEVVNLNVHVKLCKS